MSDLVSRRIRSAIRDTMNATPLAQIHTMWEDEGFQRPKEPLAPAGNGGDRVTLFQGYLDQVDWTHHPHVVRAMRVFELALQPLVQMGDVHDTWGDDRLARIRRMLKADGYTLAADGEITGGRPGQTVQVIEEKLLAGVRDPAVIRDHLDRMTAAIDRADPAQVIGSAKELIESTAKLVLNELGVAFDDKTDMPGLVRQVQEALGIHPSSIAGGADGAEGIRKILGGAVTVTNGVAELRNRGYGTGHGPGQPRTGLRERHARLTINAARLWCEFVLDTLADKQAPWRKTGDGS